MLAALIIVFREAFEAGLIIGIVMAVTRGVPYRGWWVGGGVAVGVVGACLIAGFAGTVTAAFSGFGQEFFNAGILTAAVVMLTWHNIWMARHGRELAVRMNKAGAAVASGAKSSLSLAVVVAIAVLREGFEVVLFLFGVVTSDGGSALDVVAGGVLGLALAALVCVMTYAGLIAIPSRILFGVTSLLIAFLAAGMAAQATGFLEQANVVSVFGSVVWDSSAVLPKISLLGKALHTLVGYNDQPTALQLIVYISTLAIIFSLMKVFAVKHDLVRESRASA